jgi:hypothetical protein
MPHAVVQTKRRFGLCIVCRLLEDDAGELDA